MPSGFCVPTRWCRFTASPPRGSKYDEPEGSPPHPSERPPFLRTAVLFRCHPRFCAFCAVRSVWFLWRVTPLCYAFYPLQCVRSRPNAPFVPSQIPVGSSRLPRSFVRTPFRAAVVPASPFVHFPTAAAAPMRRPLFLLIRMVVFHSFSQLSSASVVQPSRRAVSHCRHPTPTAAY